MAQDSDEQVLRALQRVVAADATSDPTRVRGMLNDLLGADARNLRTDVTLLVTAVEEGVPAELTARSAGWSASELGDVAGRLSTTRSLTQDAARWAVERWAAALGATVTSEKVDEGAHDEGDRTSDRRKLALRVGIGFGIAAIIGVIVFAVTSGSGTSDRGSSGEGTNQPSTGWEGWHIGACVTIREGGDHIITPTKCNDQEDGLITDRVSSKGECGEEDYTVAREGTYYCIFPY